VFVRIEGASATLLAQTPVQTTNATEVKGNPCSGSSVGGALDVATQGNWSGKYFQSFHDYEVGTILGETPTGNNFWTLWVNGISSSTGACSTQLHPSDHVLWFDCIATVTFSCMNNPLSLRGPVAVQVGHPTTVSVGQLDGAGHSTPFGGASVTGGGVAAVTDGSGNATIMPRNPGLLTVQAAASGATPSDPVQICVYRSNSAECALGGPPVHVIGIREHQLFRKHGPRTLRGTAGPDAAGLTDVRLSLLRRVGRHCSYFDGSRATWHRVSCHSGKPTPSFSVGASASWSYLLPASLKPGRYHLDVVATDGLGRQTMLVKAVSSLDFSVKKKR
jgi:hypothetical protein